MNDLDTQALRQALKGPADPGFDPGGPVDVTQIMARGRRLRQRRRLAVVVGCLCAAAVTGGAATAITNLAAAPPARLQPAGPGGQPPTLSSPGPFATGQRAVSTGATPTPVPTTAVPARSPTATPSSAAAASPTATALPSSVASRTPSLTRATATAQGTPRPTR